ncbi:murein transglycosylase [Utexia brackfieldae]|uniref:murein transglycosylase n=1 Tax=Utexia brackfieldae TaxID=3074108 RepID=UPI00370D2E35
MKQFLVIISIMTVLSGYVFANSSLPIAEQRKLYQQWQDNQSSLDSATQLKQLEQFKDYPLYPYALYRYLVNNIKTVPAEQVIDFIKTYADSPLSGDLQRLYTKILNDNQQWQDLAKFPIDNSLQSRCYSYVARYNNHNKKALEPIKNLWLTGQELPSSCDPILDIWQKSGARTTNLVLLRIELALKAGNINLARYLTNQLPDTYKTTRSALLNMLNDPLKLVSFSKTVTYSQFTQDIVLSSFSRLARKDPQYALKILPTIAKQQHLSVAEQESLKIAIAWQFFSPSATKTQIAWRDKIIANSKNTALIERRIRQALRDKDDKALANWINVLPDADQEKDEWRYWKAILLEKQNKKTAAKTLFTSVSQSRGYYAMLSAQKLGLNYAYDLNYPVIEGLTSQAEQTALKQQYDHNKVIQRVRELRYWQDYAAASREWRFLLSQPSQQANLATLARYAYIQGWGEHSVQATIAGKLWNNWVERFPVVYVETFKSALADKDVPVSYSLAISRQESALEPTVSSPAGARGLMQLMPATAKDTASKISDLNYASADQLYEPETNIRLGTQFLENMYQQFNKNRVLSSAAYNAGPNRVKRWLNDTHGTLGVDVFIETIPFTETRNYVKNVLVYDYIYRLILNHQPQQLLTDDELKATY